MVLPVRLPVAPSHGDPAPDPGAPALGMLPDELEDEIRRLRKERNAVILAHYYQESELQDLADFVGDSLQLSQAAAKTEADVIAVTTTGIGLLWRVPPLRLDLAHLERLARCEAGWAVTAGGLQPAPVDAAACR